MPAVTGQKKLAPAQQKKLAQQFTPCSTARISPPPQQQALLTNVQKILTDGGASLDDAVNVVTDLKAVAAETK